MMFFKAVCNIVSRFDQYKDDLIEYLNAIGTRTDIESFEAEIKEQAYKELSSVKSLTELMDLKNLREMISSLNEQQRRFFDDKCETFSQGCSC